MGITHKIFVFVLFILLFSGCSINEIDIGPKTQVTSYSEEIIKNFICETIDFESEYSNIEVYSWDKNDVKYEITKRIRGIQNKNILQDKLKDFTVNIKQIEGRLDFKSGYKGNIDNPIDRSIDLKVYLPKKIKNMNLKLDSGVVNFLDDVDYDIKFNLNVCDVIINRLNGRIDLVNKVGNVSIKNGRLKANSNIVEDIGNINIKAEIEENSRFNIETNVGNIELAIPEKSQVSFETLGTIEVNQIPTFSNNTRVKLRSGMGKITIKKY